MRVDVLFKIKSDPNLYRYLKEHSHWYKYLNRNPDSIKEMEEEMKKEYKLTPEDKLNDVSSKLKLLSNFIKIMDKD